MAKRKQESPAHQFVMLAWRNKCSACPHSWARVNQTMRRTLHLAIELGLEFAQGDFGAIYDACRGGYWFTDDGGEYFYTTAVVAENLSACKAFESFRGRGPILADDVRAQGYERIRRQRERLAVGLSFEYAGYRPVVTSFSNGAVVACTYRTRPEGKYFNKVERRFCITREDIVLDRADRRWREKVLRGSRDWPVTKREALGALLGLDKVSNWREAFQRMKRSKIERTLKSMGCE